MTAIDDSFVPQRSASVHAVEIDGDAVLLDEATARLHLLNATGTLVWRCFDGTSPLSEIVDDVSAVMDVPREQVLADSLALVRRLVDERLLLDATPGSR